MKNKITKKSTIRDVMQVLGTDLLRQGFNNNIHVAATMGSIKDTDKVIITDVRFPNEADIIKLKEGIIIRVNRKKKPIRCNNCMNTYEEDDLINIGEDYAPSCPKCNTDSYLMQPYEDIEHESETALDDYDKWDYIINNDGTLLELVGKVREILIEQKILKNE